MINRRTPATRGIGMNEIVRKKSEKKSFSVKKKRNEHTTGTGTNSQQNKVDRATNVYIYISRTVSGLRWCFRRPGNFGK